MRNLEELENGISTKISLYFDGEEKTFQLAVLKTYDKYFEKDEYEFAYICGDEYFNGTYSGGITGSGCNPRDIRKLSEGNWQGRKYTIVTTDIKTIAKLAKSATDLRNEEKEKQCKRKFEAVKKINELPERLKVEGFDKFELLRSEASFNPSYSNKIQGGGYSLVNKGEIKTYNSVRLHPYFSKDGKMLIKKFEEDMEWFIGITPTSREHAKEVLLDLKNQLINANKTVDEILNKVK